MIKVDFDFGVGFDMHGNPLDPGLVAAAVPRLAKELARLAGGCSLIPRDGWWYDASKDQLVEELGYTLTALVRSHQTVWFDSFAQQIKTTLCQQAVIVTHRPVVFSIV